MAARRVELFGQSLPKFPSRLFQTDATISCFRLEKAIADLKPPARKIDPTTNFWTIYKKVSDEHDNDMVSKYLGDLDTSLLFVSAFRSLLLFVLNRILLC